DADLWKPLAAEGEIALPSGARLGLGKFGLKHNLELHIGAGGDRFQNMNIDDGLVVFISIVRRDVLLFPSHVALAHYLNLFNFFRAIFLVFPLVVGGVAAALDLGLMHPRGFWLKRILIKMEREVVERLP